MEPTLIQAIAALLVRVEKEADEYGEFSEVRAALTRLEAELHNVIKAVTLT